MFAHGVRDCVHSHMNCFGNFWICKKELVVILWAIGPPTGGFSLKEGSSMSKKILRVCLNFGFGH